MSNPSHPSDTSRLPAEAPAAMSAEEPLNMWLCECGQFCHRTKDYLYGELAGKVLELSQLRASLSSQGTPSEPTRDFRQCPHGSGKRTDCRECKRLMDERIARGECIDCGRLHPGSSSVFTVCDACWDRAHPGRAPGVTGEPAAWLLLDAFNQRVDVSIVRSDDVAPGYQEVPLYRRSPVSGEEPASEPNDTQRMDWMESTGAETQREHEGDWHIYATDGSTHLAGPQGSIRAAIDAAMSASTPVQHQTGAPLQGKEGR